MPSEVSIARSVGAAPELSIARSVPPDGSSFQQVQFQEKVATSIPPFGYLNLQFFHKVSPNPGVITIYAQDSHKGGLRAHTVGVGGTGE